MARLLPEAWGHKKAFNIGVSFPMVRMGQPASSAGFLLAVVFCGKGQVSEYLIFGFWMKGFWIGETLSVREL